MTDNRPVLKRAMTSKKVNRTKQVLSKTFSIDYAKRAKIRKGLSFFRGAVVGVFTTLMLTTDYQIGMLFLLAINLLLVSYGLEEASKTLTEKARPKKIHYL